MPPKLKLFIVTFLLLILPIGFYYLAVPVIYGGNSHYPNIVLVVSSSDYEVANVLSAIDGMKADLGTKINKNDEQSTNNHSIYKHAYWYPINHSNIYGIALAEMDTSSWDNDKAGIGGHYFIEVYSDNKECNVCSSLKKALKKSGVKYSSPCENAINLTEYEKIRCNL